MLDWSEMKNWNEYLKLLVGLIAIIDPLALVPTFLSLAVQHTVAEKRQIAAVSSFTVLVTLLAFTFFGQAILNLFAISLAAFRVAGGLVLLLLALDMLRARDEATATPEVAGARSAISLAIVPLAIPLLAGPGAISTVIIYATLHPSLSHRVLVSAVIATVAVVVFGVLRLATHAEKLLGETSLLVFNHLMGLIIAAVALEFILGGLLTHFPVLGVHH